MEAYHGQRHPKPEGSLIEEPEFVELCRIAKRLPVEQRDKLNDILFSDLCERIASEYDHTLRIFNDGLNPLGITQESD